MSEVTKILEQRQQTYGDFKDVCLLTSKLETLCKLSNNYKQLKSYQKEGLHMILQKISRALNGDVTYVDNWQDIAGYAQLIVDELNKGNKHE